MKKFFTLVALAATAALAAPTIPTGQSSPVIELSEVDGKPAHVPFVNVFSFGGSHTPALGDGRSSPMVEIEDVGGRQGHVPYVIINNPEDIAGGVPDGGTTGQVLQKLSNADGDADWQTLTGGITFPLNANHLGSAGAPTYQMVDNDSGMYSTGDGNVSFSANGFLRFQVDQNQSTVTGPLIVTGNISAANYPPTGNSNTQAYFDGSGVLASIDQRTRNVYGGWNSSFDLTFDDRGAGQASENEYFAFRPLQDSPNETWNVHSQMVEVDPDSDGFDMGASGQFGNFQNMYFKHFGTSNIGLFSFLNLSSDIGNGTDAISMNGLSLINGFGSVADGVTMLNQLQGYGYQINVADGATLQNSTQAFYDAANYDTATPGYTSFNSSPQIAAIKNNNGFTGLNINSQIDDFEGNASFNGVNISAQLGTFDTGGANFINVNPTVTGGNYANGIYVSMDNVTATNKKAGYFDGDVEITGDLTFGGALSIGNLTAFGTLTPIDGGGNPSSVHSLVSQINIAASSTTANADTIGVNTAMLLTVGANSTTTSGAFGIGMSALALPAVIETHTGSNLDYLNGALFALNFVGSSTGGTIGQGAGGRFLAVPNGITTVDRFYGVWSSQPFGLVGTDNWAIYAQDAISFFEESVKVGGADTLSSADFGIESVKTIASDNGFQMNTSGTQPTCDSSRRGLLWNVEGGAGVADVMQVCQKNSADAYVWTNL